MAGIYSIPEDKVAEYIEKGKNSVHIPLRVDEDTYKFRLNNCNECDDKSNYGGVSICDMCGCAVETKAWTKWNSCPQNNWPGIEDINDLIFLSKLPDEFF